MNRFLQRRLPTVSRRTAAFCLAAVVLLAAALRLRGLDRHFFWFDEGLLLDLDLLRRGPRRFMFTIWRTTTYNPGWAYVVWLTSRLGGVSLWSARFPSCVAGVLNVALMYPTARALRFDRPAALAAAALAALAWPQVEYSQQVLPYAAVPLMTTAIVFLLARLDRDDPAATPRPYRLWCPLLAAACTLDVVNHNSFLMLMPFLGVALLAFAVHRRLLPTDANRRRTLVGLTACVVWVLAVSLVFYLPKKREGYRTYLDPYYVATFRDHTMGYGPFTDELYRQLVPAPTPILDGPYFALSRTYDTLLYAVNLFSPLYVTGPWGAAAVLPVSLACVGLAAALRRAPGAAPAWLGYGLAVTLGILLELSALRLYPYGGIRQLLFLSPLVVLMAASGWRLAARRWPAPVGVLSVAVLLLYAGRCPEYYTRTAAPLDEAKLAAIVRDTGAKAMVVPDFGEHYFVLNHLYRGIARGAVMDTFWPHFTTLLHRREPFLLYAAKPFLVSDFGPSLHKSGYYWEMIGEGFDFSDYDVRELISEPEGDFRGGEPSPGTFLYAFRPRARTPKPAEADAPARVLGTEPVDRTRSSRLVADVAITFSRPMDPTTLLPETLQLWTKPAEQPGASWTRCTFDSPPRVEYDPRWRTAAIRFAKPLEPALYLVVVTDYVRDQQGRPLASGTAYASFELLTVPR